MRRREFIAALMIRRAICCGAAAFQGLPAGLCRPAESTHPTPPVTGHTLDIKDGRFAKLLKSLALPSGRTDSASRHLKHKHKSASLLRHCYHHLLHPSRGCRATRKEAFPPTRDPRNYQAPPVSFAVICATCLPW
jgi:hypothetical protein